MAVRDATVGPESGTIEVSCGAISTSSYSTPSASATSWGKIVFVPWPISVDAVRIRIRPSSVSSSDCDRCELDLAGAGEAGTMPGQRQADAGGEPCVVRPALANGPRLAGVAIEGRCLRGRLQHVDATDRLAEHLAGRGDVALAVDPAPSQVERGGVERLGDAVDLHLGGELRLRRAEATEGAVGRGVRRHRATGDAHVLAPIRAAGVQHAAREDHGRERAVRPAIHDDLDLLRDQLAGAAHAADR